MRISKEVGETCNIAVPDGNQMRYLTALKLTSHWYAASSRRKGSFSLYFQWEALSSMLPQEQLSILISKCIWKKKLKIHSNRESLQRHFKNQKKKWVQLTGEFIDGMVCVAVPIFDRRKRFFATLSIHAPNTRMSLRKCFNVPF
ncbi:MAG: hypothetical protein Ct9H300mP28_31960 [Pseudomonadota bacterium]|nr:MAG: hypothetical protein Ct9H300mP28_31960 [Pseudomonadota bacterium]